MKAHFLPITDGITACGIRCWRTEWPNEADTELNNRIEYTAKRERVTCHRCLKIMKAALTSPQSPESKP